MAAPLVLLCCVVSLGFNDIYWIPAWATFTLLPPLMILRQSPGRRAWLALIVIALIGGWLQTIRSQSALGPVIAAVIVLAALRLAWWRKLLVLAAMALAYVSIGTFGISAIQHHRDAVARGALANAAETQSHPFCGIRCTSALDTTLTTTASASRTASPPCFSTTLPGQSTSRRAYESVLRTAYFNTLRDHPFAVLGQYAAKAWVTLADTVPYLLLIALTLPVLLRQSRRRDVVRWLVLIAPTFILTFVPTLVAVPLQVYEGGVVCNGWARGDIGHHGADRRFGRVGPARWCSLAGGRPGRPDAYPAG